MCGCPTLVDVPHAAAKFAAERMIETMDLPATILRPNYFFQNDAATKDALLQGIYAIPIGSVGAAMVDIRDIAEVAAIELLKRERASERLPRDLIDISGPEILTADAIAAIWTDVLGKPIAYVGDDLDAYAKQLGVYLSAEMAYDLKLMLEAWQKIGVLPMPGAVDRLVAMLDRPLRTYRAFAEETAAQWQRD
ncbi:NmrA family NAD(P)-binding protein [Chamaesiphon polymorphus]|uniref:NmrA family NAD(P)-binding protein n=1 Tax=Chamaesiphon polymorphus TaxID=2107691 RepID=UPI0011B1D113|nr:NmrA family NAD(P)-binding protein [Chamaesiphon polymorphus]